MSFISITSDNKLSVEPAPSTPPCLRVKHNVCIKDSKGGIVFEQRDVEAPADWSAQAVQVVAHKYLRGHGAEREPSIFVLVHRVVQAIVDRLKYEQRFDSETSAKAFYDRLSQLILNQKFAFNSPVWFNLGAVENPQCSACFIVSVDDSMDSIADWIRTETTVFSKGSGSGVNLSRIRKKNALTSGGGIASGPLSFALTADRNAGAIKSGGKTRRAAKMLVMDDDHPDIYDFVNTKIEGERVAKALIAAGFSAEFNAEGGAYELAPWQNANNTVRFKDAFMDLLAREQSMGTVERYTLADGESLSPSQLWEVVAQAAWECGDPGVHFAGNIHKWHTCKSSGDIRASNPCSEYLFIDDTSCNLGSFNLLKYRWSMVGNDALTSFDFDSFADDVELVTVAMDTIVSLSSYPTPRIAEQTKRFRTLGVGYANLGALLMQNGCAYGTNVGRELAALITSMMTCSVYSMSHRLACAWSSFAGLSDGNNRIHMGDVLRMHKEANDKLDGVSRANEGWDNLLKSYGQRPEMRNAQATVLAPTGTIAFMMDCDTTGIEPDLSLLKFKKLVGGGSMLIENQSVGPALKSLGYSETKRINLVKTLKEEGEDAFLNELDAEDVCVFATAFGKGLASISADAHLFMMAEVQPFLSGAISKTVNMPEEATAADIARTYLKAYNLGLKAVAVYRNNCKQSQPMSAAGEKKAVAAVEPVAKEVKRTPLPTDRAALTHKFSIAGQEGFITLGYYTDGRLGEVFATLSKKGGTIDGFVDSWCKSFSLALQYGVPAVELAQKFLGTTFDPQGFTANDKIRTTTSPVDYICRFILSLELPNAFDKIIDGAVRDSAATAGHLPAAMAHVHAVMDTPTYKVKEENLGIFFEGLVEGPACHLCGGTTKRAGACHVCTVCGTTTGCG